LGLVLSLDLLLGSKPNLTMKRIFSILLTLIFTQAMAQGSLAKYLEVGEPASFQELVQWGMDPRFAEELKSTPEVVTDFVMKAGTNWNEYSAEDIERWIACMNYMIDLGVSLNDTGDNLNSLFYLTSSNNLDLSDPATNRYQLHTCLLALGGKSETVLDDQSYLYSALVYSDEADPVRKAYIADFVGWKEDRKREWLFSIVAPMDWPEDSDVTKAVQALLAVNGFNVNIRSKNDKSSLFDAAVEAKKYETAKALLQFGFLPNQRCFECQGQTTLHNVVNNKNYEEEDGTQELIQEMMKYGADADLRDIKGFTPVHYAIMQKRVGAFMAFMSPDVKFNYQTGTLKGVNYYDFFLKEWGDQDYLQILSEKTGLKAPLTKKEQQELKAKKKQEEKAAKKKK